MYHNANTCIRNIKEKMTWGKEWIYIFKKKDYEVNVLGNNLEKKKKKPCNLRSANVI